MQIKLTSVGEVKKEKTYYFVPIAYEDQGKSKEKKIMSFTDVYPVFKEAKSGESYDVEVKKDDNGYWQWVKATLSGATGGAGGAGSSGYAFQKSYGNDQARQTSIVRQSSLAQAVNYAKDGPALDIDGILSVAEQFESWVNRVDSPN